MKKNLIIVTSLILITTNIYSMKKVYGVYDYLKKKTVTLFESVIPSSTSFSEGFVSSKQKINKIKHSIASYDWNLFSKSKKNDNDLNEKLDKIKNDFVDDFSGEFSFESLEKQIKNIKVKGIDCLGVQSGYIYFGPKLSRNMCSLLKNKKEESKFLKNKYIHELAPSSKETMELAMPFAFMDIEKDCHINKKDYVFQIRQNFEFKNNKCCSDLTKNELQELQQEFLNGMTQLYKIHIQIKEEYVLEFVKEFLKFMIEDEYGKLIVSMKVAKNMEPGRFVLSYENQIIDNPYPIIVVYLPFIPGTKDVKNETLKKFIDPILDRFKDKSSEIALNLTPRFNMQVKDFLYIAQGNSDTKLHYKKAVDDKKLPRRHIYESGYVFFKGYAFDYSSK